MCAAEPGSTRTCPPLHCQYPAFVAPARPGEEQVQARRRATPASCEEHLAGERHPPRHTSVSRNVSRAKPEPAASVPEEQEDEQLMEGLAAGPQAALSQNTSGSRPLEKLPGRPRVSAQILTTATVPQLLTIFWALHKVSTYVSSNSNHTPQGDRIIPVSQTRRLKSRVKSLLESHPVHTPWSWNLNKRVLVCEAVSTDGTTSPV